MYYNWMRACNLVVNTHLTAEIYSLCEDFADAAVNRGAVLIHQYLNQREVRKSVRPLEEHNANVYIYRVLRLVCPPMLLIYKKD